MTMPQPELLFVSGPQSGERQVLMSSPAVVGRDPDADVHVSEEAVSRRHFRIDFTQAGWILTNLSRNGTVINGKRYKSSRQQILLDTGDVIEVGCETGMLYVSSKDDPDAALADYRRQHAEAEKTPQPAGPAAEEVEGEADEVSEPPGEAEEIEQIDPEAKARKDKIRKYAIFGGIYAVAMIVLVIFLASRGGDETTVRTRSEPELLNPAEIARHLDETFEVEADPQRAEEMLERARVYYQQRNDRSGNRYRALKAFKLHLAYKGEPTFAETRYLEMHNNARRELTERVQGIYPQAYLATRNRQWRKAKRLWEKLRRMLPATEEPLPNPDQPVFENVTDHIAYVERRRRAGQ